MHDPPPAGWPPAEDSRTGEPAPTTAQTVPFANAPDDAAAAVPLALGRYRLTGRLGAGSYGTVYRGYDDELAREVAVKLFHPHQTPNAFDPAAYLAEGRALASLDHPGIVPVYDAGRTDAGFCYLVSKFVEGSDLKARLRQGRLTRAEVVALIVAVAEALHYAHQRGVVHRDVKPSNLLLDAAGRPYVADFGQALREQEYGTGPTLTGTPAYMSPEQARGEGHRVDARTDVYSLGVVLYELLTGRVPFQAGDRAAVLEQIKACEPCPPRRLDDTVPRELERICLKALSKCAAERYQTAKALAEDLRDFEALLLGPRRTGGGDGAKAPPVAVIPKGLRSFDAADADFFLELLPGPRDRDGLPEVIRFWKARLSADAREPFRVGVLYGPSGCGKSSLVKAGLLPRLGPGVAPVYLEATAEDLEGRLLAALRRRLPGLPVTAGLAQTLALVRRGGGPAPAARVLLVLDQFEQWLHGRRPGAGGGLVEALRQCDGRRVQALLLVRDDFWLAVSRFMRELEVPLVEGDNTGLVDLFDPLHARKVLAEFGRAFGRLPAHPAPPAPEQERFLDQAVAGLAEGGAVVPVRLSLFAEMVRGKPWAPATLRAVGGAAGVGVLFLEESLGAHPARPEYRLHREAARAVLQALLPERGTDIKGAVRSREELTEAAGYSRRPEDFAALLRILDGDLRLITPTDPETSGPGALATGKGEPVADAPGSDRARCYQLTHDYLVPALREWLTRKRRETRRGRAELCLDERAAEWAARPDGHHLPAGGEWLRILLFTRAGDWAAPQRKMMRAATRRYGLRLAAAAALVALLGWGAWDGWGHLRAATLVRVLSAAPTADAAGVIRDLDGYRRWADPMLRRLAAESPAWSRERLHASLALLPGDEGQVDYLLARLLEAGPEELPVIRDALLHRREEVARRLWAVFDSEEAGPGARSRAGLALAGLGPPDGPEAEARWRRHAPFLVEQLLREVRAAPASYAARAEALRPARRALLGALGAVFRDRGRPEYDRLLATTLLADYAADQPAALAELLKDADAEQYAVLLPKARPFADQTAAAMEAEQAGEARPGASDGEKEALAKRQANAAVTLLHLGRPGPVWPLLRHRDDPRLRSHLVHRLRALGAGPGPLAERLLQEPRASARRALALSLGEYPADALPAPLREVLTERLTGWYRDDPDPGLHSAVEWLFSRWGLEGRLAPVREALAGPGPVGGRRWYVNRQGQTFAVVRGPAVVAMGSPPDEADRENEPVVRRTIDRSFAVATTPVTLGQFQRFLDARGWKHTYTRKYCPEPDCPVTAVNWFTAAQYCRWLSEREEVPQDQMCFPPLDEIKEGVRLPEDYLSRTGYRLLTEAEWEYACRAGAVTSRYYGSSEELLRHYGWYTGNSGVRTHPVGGLKPNDFGLFDMHGNVWQWCQERALASRPWGGQPAPTEDREDTEPVAELHGRVLRGGAFYDHPSFLRCAARQSNRPYLIDDYFGFRVARTVR